MSHAVRRTAGMSLNEFLGWESEQEDRYEFVSGVIRMMVGGTAAHHLIAFNLAVLLRANLLPGPCRVFADGMKLIVPTGDVMYPDAMIVCTPFRPETTEIREPALVAEVTSKSTAKFDREIKRDAYFEIPTLRHYLLVDPYERHAELYTRAGETWERQAVSGRGAGLWLPALDMTLPLDAVYEGVPPSPTAI